MAEADMPQDAFQRLPTYPAGAVRTPLHSFPENFDLTLAFLTVGLSHWALLAAPPPLFMDI